MLSVLPRMFRYHVLPASVLKYKFSKPHIPGYDYSFSGIKTSLLYFVRDQIALDPDFMEKNKAAAYLVSMAAFAAIHVLGYIGSEDLGRLVLCFIQYLPAGLCLAWTYTKADNILAPTLVHAIVNAVAIGALR